MTLDTIFAFLLGCLMGFLLAAYVLAPRKETASSPQTNLQNIEETLKQQIAFLQAQNMLRNLQLEQSKQEAEYRVLERQRTLFLASAQGVRHD